MLHIRNLEEGVELFKVLGSDIRVNIILLLLKEKEMNMNEIAARLQITNGALTSHIRKLEEAGLIRVTQDSVGHGNQKVCSVWKPESGGGSGRRRRQAKAVIFGRKFRWGSIRTIRYFPPAAFPRRKR